MDGLLEAMDFFTINEGYLLTIDEEDELHSAGRAILIRPVWKWLAGFSNDTTTKRCFHPET